jgi:hypothetical protein
MLGPKREAIPLTRVVHGFAGERVGNELAEATEGKSGRELSKITFRNILIEDLYNGSYCGLQVKGNRIGSFYR